MTASPPPPAGPSFRVGRRRVVATGGEALSRWVVQQGILPRAEGGTQIPPAARLAALLADPACALPLSALGPAALVALRERSLGRLGNADAVLVEQAALAAAILALCEVHGLEFPHPLAAPAGDGTWLIETPELEAGLRTARRLGASAALALDLALATGASFTELDALAADAWRAAEGCLVLAQRRVALAAALAARMGGDRAALAGLSDRLAIPEARLRLTALTRRLAGGCHLDEAFILAGCGGAPGAPPIPWLG